MTAELEKERRRRLGDGVFNALMAHVPAAMEVLGKLIQDPDTPASVRADLGNFMYEQLHGKAAAQIKVDGKMEQTHQILATAIMLDDGRVDSHLTIDGELGGDYDKTEREADRNRDELE